MAGTWRYLTATGIYPLTSIGTQFTLIFFWYKSKILTLAAPLAGFNHSCTPSLMRFSVGPLIFFRTSRPVAYGETLTISYVGTDLLREPMHVRLGEDEEEGGGLGHRDFTCACPLCVSERACAQEGGAGAGGETEQKEKKGVKVVKLSM